MPDHNDPMRLQNMILAAVQKQIEASDLPAMIADPNSLDGQIREASATRPKRRD